MKRRIKAAWDQLTRGDKESARIHFEAAGGTACIADIGHGDVRSEGM